MTWLSDYQARLDNLQINSTYTKHMNVFDLANQIAQTQGVVSGTANSHGGSVGSGAPDPWDSYNFLEKAWHGVGNAIGGINDNQVGHSILQAADAPRNAIASAWQDILQQEAKSSNPSTNTNYNWGEVGNALTKGFFHEGQYKQVTGTDILAANAAKIDAGANDPFTTLLSAKDASPGVTDANDWQRAALGFTIDVATDPLSYIGPGVVTKIGKATGVTKAATVVGEKIGLSGASGVKNVAKELTDTGSATVPAELATQIVKTFNETPKSDLVSQVEKLPTKPVETALIPVTGSRVSAATSGMDLNAVAPTERVTVRRKGDVAKSNITAEAKQKMAAAGDATKVAVSQVAPTPARTMYQSAVYHTINRLIGQDVNKTGGAKYGLIADPVKDVWIVKKTGKELDDAGFKQYVANIANKGGKIWKNDRVDIFGSDGKLSPMGGSIKGPKGMSGEAYANAIAKGESIKGQYHIPVLGEMTPLSEYMKSRTAKYANRIAQSKKAIRYHEIAQVDPAFADVVKASETVKPARAIIADVSKGADSTILEGVPALLDRVEKEGVASALQKVAKENITVPKAWLETTARGAKTNTPAGVELGKKAVFVKGNNVMNQLTLHKGIVGSDAMKRARSTNNSKQIYNTYMNMLQSAEHVLKREGMEPILGRGASGIPLSLHDVLSSLPPDFVLQHFINYDAKASIQLLPTMLMDIAQVSSRYARGELLLADSVKQIGQLLRTEKVGSATNGMANFLKGNDQAFKDYIKMFLKAGPKIEQHIQNNLARHGIETGYQIQALRDDVINGFENLMATPHNFNGTDILRLTSNKFMAKELRDGAKATGASKVAQDIVGTELAAEVASIVPQAELSVIRKGAEEFAKATEVGGKVGEAMKAKTAVELLKSAVDETKNFPKLTYELGDELQLATMTRIIRGFVPHIATNDLYEMFRGGMVHAKEVAESHTRNLGRLKQKYGIPTMNEAFGYLKRGEDINKIADPAFKDAVTNLHNAVQYIFNDGEYGVLARNGIDVEHLNDHLKRVGLRKYTVENLDGWKKWETDNILDTMSRTFTATLRAHAEVQIGAQITELFGKTAKEIRAAGGVPVLIADTRGVSRLAKVIDKTVYYDQEIAKEMHVMDSMIEDLLTPVTNGRILHLYDEGLRMYKTGLTIYRPGHHLRNQIGDMWLSAMDGLYDPKYYKNAIGVMRVNKAKYSGWDADLAFKVHPGQAKYTYVINGKKVAVSNETIYDLAYRNGLLPEFATLEDLGAEALGTNKIAGFQPFKGKVHQGAATFSEGRDHYNRIAHFLYALDEFGPMKGATIEDALKNAGRISAERVRKWHPDGSGLGSVEKTWARRLIMFYSWIRKAIPLVVESAVMRPGAFMAYPKAMYAVAQANGIDLQSMYDPFPTDQLFPSWMQESVQGPQFGEAGSYAGIRPGIPGMDVLDQYFAGPGALKVTLGQAITPAIRVPAELLTGSKFGTGAPIGPLPDYLTSLIPNGATGNSLLGSPVMQPTGANANYDTPYLGGKSGIAAFNWLTGMGFTDMSKPSYIKSAAYEQRQKAKQ